MWANMSFDVWTLIAVAVVAFLLGRGTARDPIQRERERAEYEASIRRHRAQIKPELLAKVQDLSRQNKKINAIKLVREEMAIGLKEAKDLVESLEV